MEPDLAAYVARLHAAIDGYDEGSAEVVVEEVLRDLPLEGAVSHVLMPFLVEVGSRWESGQLSVTQEHFASHIVRSRLAAMTGDTTAVPDTARTVVVACPPGERHDIAPLAFSILLRRAGWQVRYLGADTPITDLAFACRRIGPDLVVVAASRETAFLSASKGLRRIATSHPLAIAGSGASRSLAKELGAAWLDGDVTAGVRTALDVVRDVPAG